MSFTLEIIYKHWDILTLYKPISSMNKCIEREPKANGP